MTPGVRFTSWLNAEERKALRELAERLQCSENFIVRIALRHALFNADIPAYMQPPKPTAHTLGDR